MIIPALVTDHATPATLDDKLSLIGAADWMGMVIGFALTGYALEVSDLNQTLLAAIILPLLSLLLLHGRELWSRRTFTPEIVGRPQIP